jgi:mRNA-degrading endonuclease RelE of RelBE toxin-antitoxin system
MKVTYEGSFIKDFSKIKDKELKEGIVKQLKKIIGNPEIGKPLKYSRKLTREVYMPPFRLYYSYNRHLDVLTIIEISHKRKQ